MIRIAAAGDLHLDASSAGRLRPSLEDIAEHADVLLLAGDLTTRGEPEEAAVVADELRGLPVPVVAVLGNHDVHVDREGEVRAHLEDAGVVVLEGAAETLEVAGCTLGIAGTKGFGGGFSGACASDFGEREMKSFVAHTEELADRFERSLVSLETDLRVGLLHYSPVRDTLIGEPLEIFPFLGSYLFAEAVDRAGADLVLHGHAHRGSEKGITPAGVPVRNVAQPVIGAAYNLYALEPRPAGLAAGRRAEPV